MSYEIAPVSGTTTALLLGLIALLLCLAWFIRRRRMESRVAAWTGVIVCGGLALAFAWLGLAQLKSRVVLADERLEVRIPWYGREIPLSAVDVAGARLVSFADEDYRPTLRTNGVGLPGYWLGWFRLRDGEALLAVTQGQAVYIPTTAGYAVMVSLADAEGFLRELRQRGNSHSGAAGVMAMLEACAGTGPCRALRVLGE